MGQKQILIRCDAYKDRKAIAGMLAEAGHEVTIHKETINSNVLSYKYYIVILESTNKVKIIN